MKQTKAVLLNTDIIFDVTSLVFSVVRSVVDQKDHSPVSRLLNEQMNSIISNSLEDAVLTLLKGKAKCHEVAETIRKSKEILESHAQIVKPHMDGFGFRKFKTSSN